jgi:hypothetical protein
MAPRFFCTASVWARLRLEERAQLGGHRELAALLVFGRALLQAHPIGDEIDLPPLEGQHLAVRPPAREVRERDHGPHRLGQFGAHRLKLGALEEAWRTLFSCSFAIFGRVSTFPPSQPRTNARVNIDSSRLICPLAAPCC